jgi:hypothetical protein
MSNYHYLDEGELPIEEEERRKRMSSPRFKRSLLTISLILLGAALLIIFLCVRAIAQDLPTYTLIHVEPGLKVYEVGNSKDSWGTLHFPEGGGMFFKLNNSDQGVFFPEKALFRNIILNKGYLEKVPVILLRVDERKAGKFTSSFEFYSPDKCAMYMLGGN